MWVMGRQSMSLVRQLTHVICSAGSSGSICNLCDLNECFSNLKYLGVKVEGSLMGLETDVPSLPT